MINQKQKRVLILALFAGEIMMKSGAEIYRVEDTIIRICRACKIPYVECFATTTGIFLSLDSGEQDGDMHTFIKRINHISIDLEKISRINEFSRVFTSTSLTVEEGFQQLKQIERMKPCSLSLNLLGAFLIGMPLCLTFGGGIVDSVLCGGITVLTCLISTGIARLQFNHFIRVFLSCAFSTLLTLILARFGLISTLSAVIVAAITMFLPGVAITNAARDMLSGDMLSGVARFSEALIVAVALAGGVGISMKFWAIAGGSIPVDAAFVYPPWLFFVFAFFTTLGFCFRFHVPRKHMLSASLIGGCGLSLYQYAILTGYSAIAASFLASSLVAILAEFSSRAGKDATTLFIIPGIIPLVPGTGMYVTMLYLLQSDFSRAAESGFQTLIIAGSIAVSLVIVASITRILVAVKRRIEAAGMRRRNIRNGAAENHGIPPEQPSASAYDWVKESAEQVLEEGDPFSDSDWETAPPPAPAEAPPTSEAAPAAAADRPDSDRSPGSQSDD